MKKSLKNILVFLEKIVSEIEDIIELTTVELLTMKIVHAKKLLKYCKEKADKGAASSSTSAIRNTKVEIQDNWISTFQVPYEKLCSSITQKLDNSTVLTSDEYREFVRTVCNEIACYNRSPSKQAMLKICKDVMEKFPKFFTDIDHKGQIINYGYGGIYNAMYNRLKNEYRKISCKKRLLDTYVPAVENTHEDYEKQEIVRLKMQREHSLHDHSKDISDNENVVMMRETYFLRRKQVLSSSSCKELIQLWPCLFSSKNMLVEEFKHVTNLTIEFDQNMPKRICGIARFVPKYYKNARSWLNMIEKSVEFHQNLTPYLHGLYPVLISILGDVEGSAFRVYEVSIIRVYLCVFIGNQKKMCWPSCTLELCQNISSHFFINICYGTRFIIMRVQLGAPETLRGFRDPQIGPNSNSKLYFVTLLHIQNTHD